MSIVREPSEYETAYSQIRNSNQVFVPMLRQRLIRFRRMLITRSDDGYFGRNLSVTEFLNSLRPCALAPLSCILDFTPKIENTRLQNLCVGLMSNPA